MSLPNAPIIKKFFTNKIESSRPEWGDYLLEVADIFSMFDGEELDRDLLTERFSTISGRSPYALRDVANFRDEFGAYGTYLGLFRYKNINNRWHILLSKATKHFLCSTEPDVESFCRTQLALFQYPNGAGSVQNQSGSIGIQGNIKNDTIREIENNIRINPFRLLCRTVIALHEIEGKALTEIVIPYQTIFMLVNDDAINQEFSPSLEAIHNALLSYANMELPQWTSGHALTNFKRNFHIFERTGVFKRIQHQGLVLDDSDINHSYDLVRIIGNMSRNYTDFESCYGQPNISQSVENVIKSSTWGDYYDSLTMPMDLLKSLSSEIDENEIPNYSVPLGTVAIADQPVPELRTFQSNQIRAFTLSGHKNDPFETIIRREKANREHARILNMLAALIRIKGNEPYENTFIDLYADIGEKTYIFEVKSNNERNTLSQIRKAVSQLYEYRYRSNKSGAVLCIVLQQKPTQTWIEDYLLNDREICVCWLVDDVRLECPSGCFETLSRAGIVE